MRIVIAGARGYYTNRYWGRLRNYEVDGWVDAPCQLLVLDNLPSHLKWCDNGFEKVAFSDPASNNDVPGWRAKYRYANGVTVALAFDLDRDGDVINLLSHF